MKYFIGFQTTVKCLTLNDLETLLIFDNFNAKICFLRRLDFTRLRGFRTQLRERGKKQIGLHCQRQKCSPETLVSGDIKLKLIWSHYRIFGFFTIARTCTSTTSRTISNVKVKVTCFCAFCVCMILPLHDHHLGNL